MSLQDFLGYTFNIAIIDFLADNGDEEYSLEEIGEYTGLPNDTIQKKIPELINNKIIEFTNNNAEIKKFRLKDNDIVNYLIRAALAHSFSMAEEETE